MIKKILLSLVAVLSLYLIFAAFKASYMPDMIHVERSISVNAAPEAVYKQVNNLKNWEKWSPWRELDPNQVTTYGPTVEGDGAYYDWSGNDKVGKGRILLKNCTPFSNVGMDLIFKAPWESTSDCAFKLVPEGNATKVTWTYDQPAGGFGDKLMMSAMMMDDKKMDAMLGADFEKGLKKIKELAEAEPALETNIRSTSTLTL